MFRIFMKQQLLSEVPYMLLDGVHKGSIDFCRKLHLTCWEQYDGFAPSCIYIGMAKVKPQWRMKAVMGYVFYLADVVSVEKIWEQFRHASMWDKSQDDIRIHVLSMKADRWMWKYWILNSCMHIKKCCTSWQWSVTALKTWEESTIHA